MSAAAELAAGGGLLVVGLAGPAPTPAETAVLERLQPFGVILFRRNLAPAAGGRRLAALTAALRRAAPRTLVFTDAEGGRVDRLAGLVGPAPAGERLAAASPRLARRAGLWVGHALRLYGLDADFAPVVDLDRGRRGNALDGRCLGRRPRPVIARARAFLAGLHAAGVGGCLKHFPGLGGAGEDTHLEGSRVELGAAELVRDLVPFGALGAAAGAVMAAHAAYPALDPEALPASLSPAILGPLLRRRLSFRGVVFADDLEMHALDRFGGLPQRAAAALGAGCDALPLCSRLDAAEAVAARLAAPALAARRRAAGERLATYRRRLLARRPAPRWRRATVRRSLAAVTHAAG